MTKKRAHCEPCEEPLAVFCSVLSDGSEVDEELCNAIVGDDNDNDEVLQELKDTFGEELIDEHLVDLKEFMLELTKGDEKRADSLMQRMRLSE